MKDEKTGKTYSGVRQQIVKIDGSRAIRSQSYPGLNPGDEVVSAGAFRLRNAAPGPGQQQRTTVKQSQAESGRELE